MHSYKTHANDTTCALDLASHAVVFREVVLHDSLKNDCVGGYPWSWASKWWKILEIGSPNRNCGLILFPAITSRYQFNSHSPSVTLWCTLDRNTANWNVLVKREYLVQGIACEQPPIPFAGSRESLLRVPQYLCETRANGSFERAWARDKSKTIWRQLWKELLVECALCYPAFYTHLTKRTKQGISE